MAVLPLPAGSRRGLRYTEHVVSEVTSRQQVRRLVGRPAGKPPWAVTFPKLGPTVLESRTAVPDWSPAKAGRLAAAARHSKARGRCDPRPSRAFRVARDIGMASRRGRGAGCTTATTSSGMTPSGPTSANAPPRPDSWGEIPFEKRK